MGDSLSAALEPVFLEARDDHWAIHTPDHLTMAEQQRHRLVPRGLATQLKTAIYCGDCFPPERDTDAR